MRIIKIEMEISGIDGWNIDWDNEQSRKNELAELNSDIQKTISNNCGIGYAQIKINSELTNL